MVASLFAVTELLDGASILVDDRPGRRARALIIVVRHAIIIVIGTNARGFKDNRRGLVFDDLGEEALCTAAPLRARTGPLRHPVTRMGRAVQVLLSPLPTNSGEQLTEPPTPSTVALIR